MLGLAVPSGCCFEDLAVGHAVVEVAAELLGCDPYFVAFSRLKHLPRVFAVGGDPEHRRVRHSVFDEAGSDRLAVAADFDQRVDQQGPFMVLVGGFRLECHCAPEA